jgi:hypothetical protein
MDNLRAVLNIVLSKIPPSIILDSRIQYDNITKDTFVRIAGYYMKHYTNNELENLFYYIQKEYEEQANYVRDFDIGLHKNMEGFSVFDTILIFCVKVLKEVNGEPCCRYQHLLRWRVTSHQLDEDLFTTAFLAYRDLRSRKQFRDFSWKPIIGNDNEYLNQLLRQGMADNHFHLKGSAPQFPISWISMMNNVTKKKHRVLLERYSQKRLSTVYAVGGSEEHLYSMYLEAALIRTFLFAKITGNIFVLETTSELQLGEIESAEVWKECERRSEILMYELLKDQEKILFYQRAIQNNISYFRGIDGRVNLDYAMTGAYNHGNANNKVNECLSGERWFMYEMFYRIYAKDDKFERYFNLFYTYLVIKRTIRAELVQTNDNIGFDNFEKYQDRKEDFIEETPFEAEYIKMALKGTIVNQNLLHLEARITPKKTAVLNRNIIKKYDQIMKNEEELKQRYFFVVHFIKEKDNTKLFASDVYCRHYEKRRKLQKQAMALTEFREKFPSVAVRIRGIDACASEIGCRPEVFSHIYRYLRNHMMYETENTKEGDIGGEVRSHVRQLQMTYHIGEDYQSLVDGLRAIDEAILFLNLDCGSRMGHALALGIDPEEYYESKHGNILITQQDYLDNIVWLYNCIKKFGLTGYDDLLLKIEMEYSRYFRLIYGNAIEDNFFQCVIEEAREYFANVNPAVADEYSNSRFNFRISEYYFAWLLRGDDPKCYIRGYFREPEYSSNWNRYAIHKECPRDYRIRYNAQCAYLYFLYHYNSSVKLEGQKTIEVSVNHKLIQCVKEVQRKMQGLIAKLGIGIETNPSSNYFIGSFSRYEDHPIFKLYNMGLTASEKMIEECPQLPVCINTDDQGIFSTYLENEYALLALALEKAKDENGKNRYNRMFIYQWIENVRKLGIQLSFAEPEAFTMQSIESENNGWRR